MTARLGALAADGWLAGAQRIPSPNADARPPDARIRLVVVHAISLPPDQFGGPGVIELFTNTLNAEEHPYYAQIVDLRVSAHFFIRRDGELIQFVPTGQRAWHAGESCWDCCERCNDFSIGIELEGSDVERFEDVQYARLSALIEQLRTHYPIEAVAGHSDIAPGRKTDPGPFFDWHRLALALDASPPGVDTQISFSGIPLSPRTDV